MAGKVLTYASRLSRHRLLVYFFPPFVKNVGIKVGIGYV